MTFETGELSVEHLEDMLPNMDTIDKLLKEFLPKKNVQAIDLIEDVWRGNWVLEPTLLWEYVVDNVDSYITEIKTIFVSLLVLFIIASVITTFLGALKNESTAKMAKFFFVLCELIVLLYIFRDVLDIVNVTMNKMIGFLKITIPAYMMCIALTGNGLSAVIFYKLLVGFLCLVEGILVSALLPLAEGYALLGVLESLFEEKRFSGLMRLIKDGILWGLKGMVMFVGGSGILQLIITPVIDKTKVSVLQKTMGALPGIGDIAESVSDITLVSAIAVKNSFGVIVLLVLVLIIIAPALHILVLLGTVKFASAMGGICGEKRMVECSEYVADAGFMLLRMLVTVTTMFFLTLAAMTNVT